MTSLSVEPVDVIRAASPSARGCEPRAAWQLPLSRHSAAAQPPLSRRSVAAQPRVGGVGRHDRDDWRLISCRRERRRPDFSLMSHLFN